MKFLLVKAFRHVLNTHVILQSLYEEPKQAELPWDLRTQSARHGYAW